MRAAGRPRSQEARRAILDAATAALHEDGFPAVTVEGIAARAGVAKSTVYRWWPNRAAVVMDAFLAETAARIRFPDTGSAREDLRRQFRSVIGLFNDPGLGPPLAALIAEAQHDPRLRAAFADRFIGPRRADATRVLERGVARGELRSDLDPGVAIDALYGALYYRLMVSHAPTRPGYADELLGQMWPALMPGHPDEAA